ncbi:myosin heavy chain-related [Quillaja saponaria]|uniref:Myosin heavy chain-related n=1 Tax=Quillaja saponaria TaxID=32244 RepID=A0AAD7LJF0_QUISA|nr:myosin heavy chain-related [Quillaja saponaria]
MDRFKPQRRVQINDSQSQAPKYDAAEDDDSPPGARYDRENEEQERFRLRPSESNLTEDQEPFMGMKVRRSASRHRDYKGDYLDVPSHPYLMKILQKQGDKEVLFADKVLKFTGSGKMKRRILLITDFAIYIVDPEIDALKRRIALAAVEKLCLSKLSDNFFAVVIPTEYDLLMASTRKSEIVTVLVEANKSASDYELEVVFSNRFEYNAAAEVVKEVQFDEVEGGVKTRILRK